MAKTQTKTGSASAKQTGNGIENAIGILMPRGTEKSADNASGRLRWWHGPVLDEDGNEFQVRADWNRRAGVYNFTINGEDVGHLESVGGHLEGEFGPRPIGAYWRTLQRGKKSTQRIIILPLEKMRSKGRTDATTREPVSLKQALAELRSKGQTDATTPSLKKTLAEISS